MRPSAMARRLYTTLRPSRPPEADPGWAVHPPDFVGFGAQRSGTTWWYELIAAHPTVQAGTKELHYFHRFWSGSFTDADAAHYSQWFPRPRGCIAGEWSPGYLAHFWIPPLVRRAAPSARVLVMLRDPVERYRSGLLLQSETRRPMAASVSRAFRLGCYGQQLAHVLGSFPAEQVLVLQFERCLVAPAEQLARTYRFLGIDDDFVPTDLERPRNRGRGKKSPLDGATRAALVHAYTPDVRLLVDLVPDIDLGLWPNFATGGGCER